jgi:threonine/homoserine/homoserine lactone efflux protein
LKVVGALYLLWLAVDAVRNGSALHAKAEAAIAQVSWPRTFLLGLGVNLSNPKVVLFFVTFLPQFVSPQDPHAAGKLLFFGLYFVAFTLPLCALMILGAERIIRLLQARPRILRAIDYSFAGLFGAFAIRILTTAER